MQPENQTVHTQDPYLAQSLPNHEDVLNTPKAMSHQLTTKKFVYTPQRPVKSLLLGFRSNIRASSNSSGFRTFRDNGCSTDTGAGHGGEKHTDNR